MRNTINFINLQILKWSINKKDAASNLFLAPLRQISRILKDWYTPAECNSSAEYIDHIEEIHLHK